MTKHFSRVVAALLVLTLLVEAVAPAVALAASYTDSLTSCGGGVYVPLDQTCPSQSDPVFFICMVAASAAGIAAATLLAWYPPLALGAFAFAFAAGAALCPKIQPPKPDLDITSFVIENNSAPTVGQTIRFQARIKNAGNGGTGTSFLNRFQYHWGASNPWTNFGSVSGGPIINGDRDTVYSQNLLLNRTGRLYARVCADKDNIIAETNEDNNCSGSDVYFSVTAAPPVPKYDLSVTRTGTLTAGQPQTFTGTIVNSGTAPATNIIYRMCVGNSDCSTTTTGILGSSVTIPSLGINLPPLTAPLVRTMPGSQVVPGSYVVYFCVVGYPCTSTSFTIPTPPTSPTVAQCTLDNVTWNAPTTHTFYSTQTAYAGDCDTGTDVNGKSYSRSLVCGSAGTVTNNDSTNSYRYRTCTEVNQVAATITANGATGSTSVRKDSAVTIAWNGGNADNCTVTSNPAGFSGSGKASSKQAVVAQKTIFTATCTLGSGGNMTQKSANVTVNILPSEIEI